MIVLGADRVRLLWLEADVWVEEGHWRDYLELERPLSARTSAPNGRVWRLMVETTEEDVGKRVEMAAVGIIGHCTLMNRLRDRAFGLGWKRYDRRRARWLKRNLRVITRVIVHPRYRAAGLASALVRRLLEVAQTPAVEATALMGRVHPFLERAGMRRVGEMRRGGVYYVWEQSKAK